MLAVTRAAKLTFTSAQNRRESERTHTHTDVGQVTVSVVDFSPETQTNHRYFGSSSCAAFFLHLQEVLPANASCRIIQTLTTWRESDRTSSA